MDSCRIKEDEVFPKPIENPNRDRISDNDDVAPSAIFLSCKTLYLKFPIHFTSFALGKFIKIKINIYFVKILIGVLFISPFHL